MALTLNQFCGFETGGFEEAGTTSGSPDATEATTVRTGVRSLRIPASPTNTSVSLGMVVADAGTDGAIFGFAFRATDVTPSSEDQFFDVLGGAPGGNLHLESDGDLVWKDAQATPVTQLTITSPFTVNQWHYIELYIGSYNTSTGSVEIFIDGTSAGSVSNVNTGSARGTGSIFRTGGNGGTYYFDDAYILTGVTAASQRLTGSSGTDEVHVKGYQSQLASDTDNGSALDITGSPTWAKIGELPFVSGGTNQPTGYTTDNANGSTDTDNGTRSGPSGDSDVSGATIIGAKWLFTASRTSGSNSSPFLRYGSTGGTTDAVDGTDITLGTEVNPATVFSFLSESTNVPSTSQYFRLGMGKGSGGRDIKVGDAIGTLLYTQAGSSNKTLTAAGGSYSVSGTTASLLHDRTTAAAGGTYAISGTDATLRHDWTVTAESGSYAISGTAASPLHDWIVTAESGSYAINGTDATLNKGQTLAAEGGSYAISGTDASLVHDIAITAEGGSYSISGTDAATLHDWTITAAGGSYAISGAAASLVHDWIITAAGGSYAISGADVTLTKTGALSLDAEAGSYSINGTATAAELGRNLAAAAGSYAISGSNVNLNLGKIITAEGGVYTLLGQAASLLHNRTITAGEGAYLISGTDAALTLSEAEPEDELVEVWWPVYLKRRYEAEERRRKERKRLDEEELAKAKRKARTLIRLHIKRGGSTEESALLALAAKGVAEVAPKMPSTDRRMEAMRILIDLSAAIARMADDEDAAAVLVL